MAQQIHINTASVFEEVQSAFLFTSDFYQIKHLGYHLTASRQCIKGYNESLCMVYVKRGNFLLDYFNRSYDMHSGFVLLDKPDYEYRIRPSEGACTIFNFTEDFYKQYAADNGLQNAFFFSDRNILSVMLRSNPVIDYLHYQIAHKVSGAGKLEMDSLVLDFFSQAAALITSTKQEETAVDISGVKKITAVEIARDYINENFAKDISLCQIAASCFISPFHFSRIFKKVTTFSPGRYLQDVRLKNAALLLKNTAMPVTDIAWASGFNSTAYFATSFRQQYKMNPVQYRKLN